MKRLFFLLILWAIPFSVYAHETMKQGNTTMFVHIDPNEPPIVGAPSTIFINLTSSEKNFSVKNCNCNLDITYDNVLLIKVPLEVSNDEFGIKGIPVTFMTEGSYHLSVSGSPKTSAVFNPFIIDEDIEIFSSSTPNSHHSQGSALINTLHLIILWGGIGASTIVIYRERKEIFKKK